MREDVEAEGYLRYSLIAGPAAPSLDDGCARPPAGLRVEQMAHGQTAPERRTYLVEHYRRRMRVQELRRSAARVRDTVARMEQEEEQVEFVSSTVVPRDEYFLSLLSVASEQLVRQAFARADIPFERIWIAVEG
jgi:hypothetical protein